MPYYLVTQSPNARIYCLRPRKSDPLRRTCCGLRPRRHRRAAIAAPIPQRQTHAETYPGLLSFRFDARFFFANAPNFRESLRAAVAEDPLIRVVLVDAEPIR